MSYKSAQISIRCVEQARTQCCWVTRCAPCKLGLRPVFLLNRIVAKRSISCPSPREISAEVLYYFELGRVSDFTNHILNILWRDHHCLSPSSKIPRTVLTGIYETPSGLPRIGRIRNLAQIRCVHNHTVKMDENSTSSTCSLEETGWIRTRSKIRLVLCERSSLNHNKTNLNILTKALVIYYQTSLDYNCRK